MEEFELKSLNKHISEDDDVHNYYEISDAEIVSLGHENIVSEFDFFTKTHSKSDKKVKNKKKKDRALNESLMDMVNAEIAVTEAPIQKNVISHIEFPDDAHRSYLVRKPLLSRGRSLKPDMEWGIAKTLSKPDFSPVFPKIVENAFGHHYDIHVQYTKPVQFEDFIDGHSLRREGETDKFLCIKIKDIRFSSHHSFCLEELLIEKLISVYDEYQVLQNRVQKVTKDLMVKREAKDNFKQKLLEISIEKENSRHDPTLIKYAEKYFELKQLAEELNKKENEVFNNIVSLWADVETLRNKVGPRTPYELQLTEQKSEQDEYEKKWSQMFTIELYDMLEKVEFEYVSRYAEYKANKHRSGKGSHSIQKPKLHIDEDVLKEKAEENVNRILRKKYITVKLIKNQNYVKKSKKLPKSELNSINYKYSFKIYVDECLVCETDKYCVNDFKADLSETFSVQILKENVSLIIVLSENMDEKCINKISIANINNTKSGNHMTVDFAYSDIIEPNSRTIGSGYSIKEIAASCNVRLKSSNLFPKKVYSQCRSNITIDWNQNDVSNDDKIKVFYEVQQKIKRLLHGSESPTLDTLKYLIEKVYDTDVSKNEQVMNSLKALCKNTIHQDSTFEVNTNSEDLIRIQLLHLRSKGGFCHMSDKLIPLYSNQITTEQLNCLQISKDDEANITRFSFDKSNADPIELQRFLSAKYIEKLNGNLAKAMHESLLKKTYNDVVADFGNNYTLRRLISMESNRLTFADITGFRRQSLDEFTSKEQELYVNVLRAFNLPERAPFMLSEDNVQEIGDNIAGFRVRSLRPFVKVEYQGETAQTGVGIGCHPTWNQTLHIKIKPGNLSIININVFDEERINITENDENSPHHSGTFHFRTYNKWLGSVQIPLYSVFSLGKVKGTYKINVPPLLLGYETAPRPAEAADSFVPGVGQLLNKEHSYLYLQVSTSVSHLGGAREARAPAADSDDYVLKHLNTFIDEYQQEFPQRRLSLTLLDRAGRRRCVTQFIQPLPPPDLDYFPRAERSRRAESAHSKSSHFSRSSSADAERGPDEAAAAAAVDGVERALRACRRYVALIPGYEPAGAAVTLTGPELLRVVRGSALDRTLLLASYYAYLGVRARVAVGAARARGPGGYVLTPRGAGGGRARRGASWLVHDAVTGEVCDLRAAACPLTSVEYIFDADNIWVNVQPSTASEHVAFDLARAADWRQVFTKDIYVAKQPILNDAGLYRPPLDVENLRSALENKIKMKIQKWRSRMKTVWNRYCAALLRESLAQWEQWALDRAGPAPAPPPRLRQLMLTYKVYGFPLNVPYAGARAAVRAVRAAALHAGGDELALAVAVRGYPNDVLSVWLYLATITRV